jgi:hypothetical protein
LGEQIKENEVEHVDWLPKNMEVKHFTSVVLQTEFAHLQNLSSKPPFKKHHIETLLGSCLTHFAVFL